jgi:hypothetical protein
MRLCGVTEVEQWHGGDLVALMREYEAQHSPDEAWAPHAQASHPHHLEASKAAAEVFGERVRWYHTYDAGGKVRSGRLVRPRKGWADIKRQALACYQTQATHPRARVFYDEAVYELDEYAAAAPLQSSKKAV